MRQSTLSFDKISDALLKQEPVRILVRLNKHPFGMAWRHECVACKSTRSSKILAKGHIGKERLIECESGNCSHYTSIKRLCTLDLCKASDVCTNDGHNPSVTVIENLMVFNVKGWAWYLTKSLTARYYIYSILYPALMLLSMMIPRWARIAVYATLKRLGINSCMSAPHHNAFPSSTILPFCILCIDTHGN